MHLKMKANAADALLSTPRARAEEQASIVTARHFLEVVGLKGRGGQLAKNLPYGDQRRSRSPGAGQPAVAGPARRTHGGDETRETREMTELISRLRHDLGLSFLLIEHDMKVVRHRRPDHRPRSRRSGSRKATPEEVRTNPRVIEAYLGKPPNEPATDRLPVLRPAPRRARRPAGPGRTSCSSSTTSTRITARSMPSGGLAGGPRGEIVTLIGPTRRKTTTLKTISGSSTHEEGQLRGPDISRSAAHQPSGRGSAFAEGRRISRADDPRRTSRWRLHRPQNDIQGDLDHVFELFPRLKERIGQRGGACRGASSRCPPDRAGDDRQAPVLLLDEPSLACLRFLSSRSSRSSRRSTPAGTTILLVSRRPPGG